MTLNLLSSDHVSLTLVFELFSFSGFLGFGHHLMVVNSNWEATLQNQCLLWFSTICQILKILSAFELENNFFTAFYTLVHPIFPH